MGVDIISVIMAQDGATGKKTVTRDGWSEFSVWLLPLGLDPAKKLKSTSKRALNVLFLYLCLRKYPVSLNCLAYPSELLKG